MSDVIEIDPTHFRRVCGNLATGVTIITANSDDGPTGMAANSVTSVSLEPPLILFCPAKSSSTWKKMRESGAFCINVMAGHHEELTRRFATRGADRFSNVAYEERRTGPALTDAVAWIGCTLHEELDAGDHTIVVARVVDIGATTDAIEPLVFFRGSYGSFREA